MPANMFTERMPPRARSSRFSTLPAATDKIVISRNVLLGLCLTTFAFGIVTTLAIDHLHARSSELPAPREPEPVVLRTTPIEPAATLAPAAEAVVVQLAPVAEKAADRSGQRPTAKMVAHLPPATTPRVARPMTAAPVRAPAAPVSHRRSAALQDKPSSTGTEAAPDDDSPMPAPTKKKWVDPFDQ
jgi:predicted outer membrane lipoprotein